MTAAGSARTRAAWAIAAIAAALAAVVGPRLPAALAAVLLAAATLVLPGALLVARAARDRSPLERWAATLALSPALWAGSVTVLVACGVPIARAAQLVAFVLALLAAFNAWRPPAPAAADGDRGATRGGLVAALAWAGLVAVVLTGNPTLPPRSDGWFHAGVVLQIAQRGLPPEDPYFAGLRLLYFWGYHAWAATWLVLAPALAVWTPLIAFQLSAAAAVMLAVGALARRFAAGAAAAGLACALAALAYAPGAWGWLAARAAAGDVRGWDEVRRTVNAGVDPVMQTLGTGMLHASLAFFGDKFLVLTPFSMGLALFALGVLALVDLVASPGARRATTFAAVLAAGLFTHTVVGDVLVLVAGAVWLACALRAGRDAAARATLAPLALAALAAALVTAPYLVAVSAGKRVAVSAGLTPAAVVSLLWGAAVVGPAALVALLARTRRAEASALLVVAATLAALALLVKLPENNQSKFDNLLLLALAAPAAAGLLLLGARFGVGARAAGVAGLALLLVPTAALALWGFVAEHGGSAASGFVRDESTRAAMRWARANTPANAVFADLGGARDVLTLAGRSVLWGGPTGERDWGYPPAAIETRRATVRALCAGEAPPEDGTALIATLGRPVVVVARGPATGDSLFAPEGATRFRRLFRNESVGFYALEASR